MKRIIGIALLSNVVGCASIVTGHDQTLSVETKSRGAQVTGAQCKLANDKGTWFVTTPGSVTVRRSYDALHVSCEKEGYAPGNYATDSSTKAMAFGNILFGGLIGAGVDVATGAAYDYPGLISFEMVRTMPTQAMLEQPPLAQIKASAPVTRSACHHYTIGKDGRLTPQCQ